MITRKFKCLDEKYRSFIQSMIDGNDCHINCLEECDECPFDDDEENCWISSNLYTDDEFNDTLLDYIRQLDEIKGER